DVLRRGRELHPADVGADARRRRDFDEHAGRKAFVRDADAVPARAAVALRIVVARVLDERDVVALLQVERTARERERTDGEGEGTTTGAARRRDTRHGGLQHVLRSEAGLLKSWTSKNHVTCPMSVSSIGGSSWLGNVLACASTIVTVLHPGN